MEEPPSPTDEQNEAPTGVYSTVYTKNRHPISPQRHQLSDILKVMLPVLKDKNRRHNHRLIAPNRRSFYNAKKHAPKIPYIVVQVIQAQLAFQVRLRCHAQIRRWTMRCTSLQM